MSTPDEPRFLGRPPPAGDPPAAPSAPSAPAAAFDLRGQCAAGEAADALLVAGRDADAERAYQALIDRVMTSGRKVDGYIVAKAVLGVLLARLARGDAEGAHAVWTAGPDCSSWQLGIIGLEHGQVSGHDTAVYIHAGAILHSLNRDRKAALAAVNEQMGRLAHFAETSAPALLPIVATSWPRRLETIFEVRYGEIPPAARRVFETWRQRQGTLAAPSGDDLRPGPWAVHTDAAIRFHPDGRVTRR